MYISFSACNVFRLQRFGKINSIVGAEINTIVQELTNLKLVIKLCVMLADDHDMM